MKAQFTRVRTLLPRRVMIITAVGLAVGLSYLAGAYQERWIGHLGSLVGINRSTETLDLSSLQRTYQYLKANYDGEISEQALLDGANKGMVSATGDIHSSYLTKAEAEQFNQDLEGEVGAGIGVVIGLREDRVTITKLLEDNPAIRAGLKQGDVITAVNGQSTDGWDADEASSKIRGQPKTSVKLDVARGDETKQFTVTREIINNPSITGDVQNEIGIMTISRFDAQTGSLAKRVAESFAQQNVRGVIVDVRSDGGGYLNAAVTVADLWLSDKLIVTQKQGGRVIEQERSGTNPVLEGIKTVVLVNGGTASASEILAAALRDNDAATLVGEKTYGKGSVQQLIDLNSGGDLLKVTVAHWYTPRDRNVTGNGLTPDSIVELTDEDANAGRDPQLERALETLR